MFDGLKAAKEPEVVEEKKVDLARPDVVYLRKIESIFYNDPDLAVIWDEENNIINIKVKEGKRDKAFAISKILPGEVNLGGLVIRTRVLYNGKDAQDMENVLKAAFEGNPCVEDIMSIQAQLYDNARFVIFKKEVVQYLNDNPYDVHGVCSTLYENIARELFDFPNVYFCTEVSEDLKK